MVKIILNDLYLLQSKLLMPVFGRSFARSRFLTVMRYALVLILLPVSIIVSGQNTSADNEYCKQSRAESLVPIRPGIPGKQPFWNGYARVFKYAPSFNNVPNTWIVRNPKKYLYSAFSFTDRQYYTFTAASPFESLTPIWDKIPNGEVYLKVEGIDSIRSFLSGSHLFYKAALFCPPYPEAKYSYKDALMKGLQFLYNQKHVKQWIVTGKPDHKDYQLYCYPAKIVGRIVQSMLMYNKYFPENDTSLLIARKAADYLISTSEKAGSALEYFPQVYEGTAASAGRFGNEMIMMEPLRTGMTYLELYEKTRDKKYFDAALNIANTYIKNQLPSGTWYIRINKQTGKPASDVLCIPIMIVNFLSELENKYNQKQFQDPIESALKWIWENPMKTYDWTGQFEDVAAVGPYQNLTKFEASWFAQYLLDNKDKDSSYKKLAIELIAFCEDQFVFWERPKIYDNWGTTSNEWHSPSVVEQYKCYVPINSSCDQMILTYIKAYEKTGELIYREKAKTLANSVVNYQMDDGMIRTFMFPGISEFWLNCMTYSLVMLEKMSTVK
jgi:hypothetical protein